MTYWYRKLPASAREVRLEKLREQYPCLEGKKPRGFAVSERDCRCVNCEYVYALSRAPRGA